MDASNNIHVSDELLAVLRDKALAQGKSVDQMAEDVLRQGLEEHSWQEILDYGTEKGRARNFREEESADIVHAWRKGQ